MKPAAIARKALMTTTFVKLQRQPTPKKKPNRMTEAEWEAILIRWKYAMAERQGRRIKKNENVASAH
jgi:hypothetical protein